MKKKTVGVVGFIKDIDLWIKDNWREDETYVKVNQPRDLKFNTFDRIEYTPNWYLLEDKSEIIKTIDYLKGIEKIKQK